MTSLPPSLLLIVGALFVPFFPKSARSWYVIVLAALSFVLVLNMEPGLSWQIHFFGYDLTMMRVDKLSRVFAYVFTLNALAAFVYAFYMKESTQHVAALFYIGSALGAVFAGDLVSLYFYWEIMAVASTFLILARRTRQARGAAMRYVMVHIFGGLCLLAGMVVYINSTGSVAFEAFSMESPGTYLMLFGILVNAAAPPLSAWLIDAYPAATITGGVIMSAYTTKTAVYALVRGFPGWEILVVVGSVMALYGVIYALMSNDIRKVLAYSIINQAGFMVVGVGIGTAMSLNGTVSHAFVCIIYTSLLWMGAGAIMKATGTSKFTELGGLYRVMPATFVLFMVGALTISALPGTAGFTTKTLVIEAAVHEHMTLVYLALKLASAGALLYGGLKLPYFVFFGEKTEIKPGETSQSMLIAMFALAILCLFYGLHPDALYHMLPFEMHHYEPFSAVGLLTQFQLMAFTAVAFLVLLPMLKKAATVPLDTDWFYRKGAPLFDALCDWSTNGVNVIANELAIDGVVRPLCRFVRVGPASLALLVMTPYWALKGLTPQQRIECGERLFKSFSSSSLPIGLYAIPILVYLGILFFA